MSLVDNRPEARGVALLDAEQGRVRVSLYVFRAAHRLDQRQFKLADLLLLRSLGVLNYLDFGALHILLAVQSENKVKHVSSHVRVASQLHTGRQSKQLARHIQAVPARHVKPIPLRIDFQRLAPVIAFFEQTLQHLVF